MNFTEFQKDHFIRYRNFTRYRSNKLTIGIATICDTRNSVKIIYCADRLVSAGVKYEGLPKIQIISDSIRVISSTNDADSSDAILNKARSKLNSVTTPVRVSDFVNILKDECLIHKKEKIKQDVLESFQIVFDHFEKQPENMLKDARDEVKNYKYHLECEFLVFGLDIQDKSAHIFVVNQNGSYTEYDSSGFATIGEASGLAFAEITKYSFNRFWDYEYVVPLVYRTKKICEDRYESVGEVTDFEIMFFSQNAIDKQVTIQYMRLIDNSNLTDILEKAIQEIDRHEREIMGRASKESKDILEPKPKAEKIDEKIKN